MRGGWCLVAVFSIDSSICWWTASIARPRGHEGWDEVGTVKQVGWGDNGNTCPQTSMSDFLQWRLVPYEPESSRLPGASRWNYCINKTWSHLATCTTRLHVNMRLNWSAKLNFNSTPAAWGAASLFRERCMQINHSPDLLYLFILWVTACHYLKISLDLQRSISHNWWI